MYSTTSSDVKRLFLESTGASGICYFSMRVRNQYKSLLYQNNVGLNIQAETANTNIYFIVNDGTSNLQPLRINPNGVIHVGGNAANNKLLSL